MQIKLQTTAPGKLPMLLTDGQNLGGPVKIHEGLLWSQSYHVEDTKTEVVYANSI